MKGGRVLSQQTSAVREQIPCVVCSELFEQKSPRQRFCSATCRSRSYRSGGSKPHEEAYQPVEVSALSEVSKPPASDEPRLVVAARTTLEAAGRLETFAGQQAMHLAEQMSSNKVAIGVAALNKELTATMDRALLNVAAVDDPVDEVKARRDRKRAG